ncbi:CaiF/GrlA family transcriptional regulator [Escherichia coli]|uniref:CaiF/GrlA family transcriptional regulator n=2 Tax=Escherichia TaxID=561 RepID=UPI00077FCCC4|nr:CaiF/GrlA family transcriptional regulator [Escherichia coli]EEY3895108.1 CaiF/GrlA family transcriptional regulator [Escherichia coli]EFC1586657.1 CaiF/GrlA family transcriptional regulator [Escherichia coli]EFE9640363.1 CaiF/GrlA family transcriptional regulator [Escherichia coli]EFE9645024.1 CaiF/GrlA family transcriptional regulator [Escherichia coli]EFH3711733.1 CaiF/GrlA family transcriptional regulator [Escherichia coli]
MDNFTEFYSYNIPDNVSDIAEQPLYILVACWGFRRKQFLTTSTVAKEFLITQRRAMDILHYIKNEGSKNITFENKILFTGPSKNIKTRALKITNVIFTVPQKKNKSKNNNIINPTEKEFKNHVRSVQKIDDYTFLRKWLISRKTGESFSDIEKYLPSKAKLF